MIYNISLNNWFRSKASRSKAQCFEFGAILLVVTLAGCVPRNEAEVVVYSSVDREYAGPIFDAFERLEKAPNRATSVARQFDVEASKTLGLATRIFQERERPKCDVFWNGEILHTIRMQQAGLLVARNWKLPDGWPKSSYAASDGTWVGLGARARVILLNSELVPNKSDWPSKVSELGDIKWRKKCGIAKPLYGTTATHMMVLATRAGESSDQTAEFGKWMEAVASNAVVLSGNKQVAQAVSSGQLSWGVTDTDDAQIEVDNGANVVIIYPDQQSEECGCLLIPSTIAVIKNGPHPIAAEMLAKFLSSQGVENRMTTGNAATFSLWPNGKRSVTNPNNSIRFMKVDFEAAALGWGQKFESFQKVFP